MTHPACGVTGGEPNHPCRGMFFDGIHAQPQSSTSTSKQVCDAELDVWRALEIRARQGCLQVLVAGKGLLQEDLCPDDIIP